MKIVYNRYMEKSVFIKLFKIEDSNVLSIKQVNKDLIIEIETDVLSFAMGNNIRESEYYTVKNIYIFKSITDISSTDLFKINAIFNSTYFNELICFDTNLGKVYFNCEEVLLR